MGVDSRFGGIGSSSSSSLNSTSTHVQIQKSSSTVGGAATGEDALLEGIENEGRREPGRAGEGSRN